MLPRFLQLVFATTSRPASNARDPATARMSGFSLANQSRRPLLEKWVREQVKQQLLTIPESEERLLIATGRYIGEGFDDARLDTLFLAMPISWHGTLAQYAGRLHRTHHAKKEVVIYDYVDGAVPMLAKMADKRVKGYERLGYKIGSATGEME